MKKNNNNLDQINKDLDELLNNANKLNAELKRQNNREEFVNEGKKNSLKESEQASTSLSSREQSSIFSRFFNYVKSFFSESAQEKNTWKDFFKDPFGLKVLEEKRNMHLKNATEKFREAGDALKEVKQDISELRKQNVNKDKFQQKLKQERAKTATNVKVK